MGDVVSIEVDGDPGGPQLERSRVRPSWGMPAAVLVVVALILGVGWTVLRSGDASSTASPPAVSTPTTASRAPATTGAPLVVGGSSTTAPAPTAPDLHDPVVASRAALAAWGDFAVTGNLSAVRQTFAPGGPQLSQLEQESERLGSTDAAESGYVVTLTDASVDAADGVATVTGTVVWSRTGETDQAYRWAIELHQADGGWRLFTVRTVEG